MKEEKKKGCCTCGKAFEKQVKKSVDAVENYTEKDRREKKDEVETAFAEKKKR